MKKSMVRCLALALAIPLGFAACGDDDDNNGDAAVLSDGAVTADDAGVKVDVQLPIPDTRPAGDAGTGDAAVVDAALVDAPVKTDVSVVDFDAKTTDGGSSEVNADSL